MQAASLDYEFPVMHSEHRYWHEENERWKKDIAAWQRELARTWQQLRAFEERIQELSRALAQHAADIEKVERSLEHHEASMHAYEHGQKELGDQEALREQHREQAMVHVAHRNRHEQLGKSLNRFLGKVEMLVAQLS